MNDDKKTDNLLAFTFNGSLVNHHFEEILDLISEKQTKRKIKVNKEKIINYLSETFTGITEEKLINFFTTYVRLLPENYLKKGNIKEIRDSLNKFSQFILQSGDSYKDHGYSLVLGCYFWLTDKY